MIVKFYSRYIYTLYKCGRGPHINNPVGEGLETRGVGCLFGLSGGTCCRSLQVDWNWIRWILKWYWEGNLWLIHEGLRIGQNAWFQWVNLPWILPGVKKTKSGAYLHLVLRLIVRGAVPPLPLRLHWLIYCLINLRIETGRQCNIA
jgi:hypothetical protein